jgi:hypothetical protein
MCIAWTPGPSEPYPYGVHAWLPPRFLSADNLCSVA